MNLNEEILNKIRKYIEANQHNYNIDYKFQKFISENDDVLLFLQEKLQE
jgi:hypothetical protein